MRIPKVYFQYAYPLDRERRSLFELKNVGEYPSYEEISKTIDRWKDLWIVLNVEGSIVEKLVKLTSITLPYDLIVYLFGGGINPMSAPLMIPIMGKQGHRLSDEEFIETAIHEISHCFVASEDSEQNTSNYWKYAHKQYEKETVLTQNHVIVFALLHEVLPKVVGEENMEKYLNPWHPEYKRALDIAREEGPEKLLFQFREFVTGK